MIKKIASIVLFCVLSFLSNAQCAMCRATAEQASADNGGIAEGLNTGIVYLMFLPYLLFLIGGLVFFRKRIISFFKD
ncbi:MAG: hypothetical protein RLZZ205_714 [Bacteroidota bacterium]|jgi:hypothetical protein